MMMEEEEAWWRELKEEQLKQTAKKVHLNEPVRRGFWQ